LNYWKSGNTTVSEELEELVETGGASIGG